MRAIVAAVAAASMLAASGPAAAFDVSHGQPWQPSTHPAAVAYFKLTFNPARNDDRMVYGLALTAPMPGGYGAPRLAIAETPKLLDLRFNGVVPDALRVTGQVAWAKDPSAYPDGPRLNLLGGLGDMVLGLAGTAIAVYGIYSLVKKKCPAVSTSTGGCVQTAN